MEFARFEARSLFARLAVELGPVFLFFGLVQLYDIFVATFAFMVATGAAALVSWRQERRLPVLPLIGVAFAGIFGGITLALRDPLWIVLRPTIYNLLAAAVLVVALQRGRLILKSVFGSGLAISDSAWRALTWRLIGFLICLGLLNELVWRSFGIEFWVAFKAFAVPILDLLFLALNWPFVSRQHLRGREAGAALGN